jgi:hypothetical protein
MSYSHNSAVLYSFPKICQTYEYFTIYYNFIIYHNKQYINFYYIFRLITYLYTFHHTYTLLDIDVLHNIFINFNYLFDSSHKSVNIIAQKTKKGPKNWPFFE